MQSKANISVEIFNKGFNCAQAVLCSHCGEYGLSEAIAKKTSCGFGAGMGYTDNVCGAVTGALMLIGLKYGKSMESDNEAKEKTYKLVKEFTEYFKKEYGSIKCTELIRYDLSKEEELLKARTSGVFTDLCSLFVKRSVELVEKLLEE